MANTYKRQRIMLSHSHYIVLGVLATFVVSTNAIDIYGAMQNFVKDFGQVLNDVSEGVSKLSKGIRRVERFLDATIDEDCVFECQPGFQVVPNKTHLPTANGCGAFGLEEYITKENLPMSEFIDCCNEHDVCYETCGSDKDECDLNFKKCLYGHCRSIKKTKTLLKYKGCQAGAKILYTGTTALGCSPFIEAQDAACICQPIRDEF